jgi:2-phosphosulfolactate phosphatase
LNALAPADVIIVVDVLSFSTCVDVATSRGAVILPYPWMDSSAVAFADANHAELAGAAPRYDGKSFR